MAQIFAVDGKIPSISAEAFIAPTATIIGDVVIEAGANIWYGAVLRGDSGRIVIGARSSIQDNVVIHVNKRNDTLIGEDVIVGHGAVLEGCHIGKGALIGMNATILSGSVIGDGVLIGAGSVVRENFAVPAHHLAVGVPAKVRGELSAELRARLARGADEYQKYAELHRLAEIVV